MVLFLGSIRLSKPFLSEKLEATNVLLFNIIMIMFIDVMLGLPHQSRVFGLSTRTVPRTWRVVKRGCRMNQQSPASFHDSSPPPSCSSLRLLTWPRSHPPSHTSVPVLSSPVDPGGLQGRDELAASHCCCSHQRRSLSAVEWEAGMPAATAFGRSRGVGFKENPVAAQELRSKGLHPTSWGPHAGGGRSGSTATCTLQTERQ